MFKYTLVVLAAGLASCGEPKGINSAGTNSIDSIEIRKLDSKAAACAAGRSVTLSASLKADLVEAIKGKAALDASARQALVGAVFEGADISDPNVLSAYQTYESCLRTLEF